jgi:hypothetical protein
VKIDTAMRRQNVTRFGHAWMAVFNAVRPGKPRRFASTP